MRRRRRYLVVPALAVVLATLLILTGAPLWLRLLGYAAGFVVIFAYAGFLDDWRKIWREGWHRAKEEAERDRQREADPR
jgi:hypothetical protein